jgi:hypothetical protein
VDVKKNENLSISNNNSDCTEDSISPNKKEDSKGSNLKSFFDKKKSKKVEANISNVDKDKCNNSKPEEHYSKEMQQENHNENFKQFLKSYKGDSKITEELQSSHKMLIELNKIQCDIDENSSPDKLEKYKAKYSDKNSNDDFDSNNSNNQVNLKNLKEKDEEDEVKNEIYDNDNTKEEPKDEKSKEIDQEEQRKILISSDDDIDALKQEVIAALGERVYKAAYGIVFDNVSI